MTAKTGTGWGVYAGAAVALGGVAALLVYRDEIIAAALLGPPSPPSPGAAPAPVPVGAEPVQLPGSGPIRLLKTRTYFAVVNTSGGVSLLANPARVESEARKQGFRDVFVSKGARPEHFPGKATGDYYVRATYLADDRDIAREKDLGFFVGGVRIVDAWLASL